MLRFNESVARGSVLTIDGESAVNDAVLTPLANGSWEKRRPARRRIRAPGPRLPTEDRLPLQAYALHGLSRTVLTVGLDAVRYLLARFNANVFSTRQTDSAQERSSTPTEASVSPETHCRDCHHCGAPCGNHPIVSNDKSFCCNGCLTVFELLTESGLGHFYDLGTQAGIRVGQPVPAGRFGYLDDPSVRERLIDFSEGNTARVRFQVPAVHCVACVWLLENLFRLNPAVGRSRVDFGKKELTITFDPEKATLSELAALVTSLGYEPSLSLAALEEPSGDTTPRRLWLQVGVAGFAFGNIMLFSLPAYLGLRAADASGFSSLFGYLSLALALPVLVYSASDYWRSALAGLRQRVPTIDLPIAIGMAALFAQSAHEILAGRGEGYLDSLTGLVFFLLCGKAFQRKTYERLSFDHDYRSFFPLSVRRKLPTGEELTPISRLEVGDRLLLRHGELIPADSRGVKGDGLIDYSFVTGESDPVRKSRGDLLYAGGRVAGSPLEVEIRKPVSQSYLTSLWANEIFSKPRSDTLNTLTNRFSRWFTLAVTGIAIGAAAYWAVHEPSRALLAFTSVLIVACPCALALAAPFALGTAQRLLGRRDIFLRNAEVTETLAKVDSIVFDKTGTLTTPGDARVRFRGPMLSDAEEQGTRSLMRQSTHPLSRSFAGVAAGNKVDRGVAVTDFAEKAGQGIKGRVEGRELLIGSERWLSSHGVRPPPIRSTAGGTASVAHVAINGEYRGTYGVRGRLRPGVDHMVRELEVRYDLTLLTGDNDQQRGDFEDLLGENAHLHFRQSPADKLEFVQGLQDAGKRVMMVGDGLNDAGALRQSNVGVALVEDVGSFSPASDVILHASAVPEVGKLLRFSRGVVVVIGFSLALSVLYNVLGISFAARGLLSPLFCAILMPLSSISVVAFACGATTLVGRRTYPEMPANLGTAPEPGSATGSRKVTPSA